MQSDWKSFCEDIVLGSFNMASRYEDSNLDQIYKRKLVQNFIKKPKKFTNPQFFFFFLRASVRGGIIGKGGIEANSIRKSRGGMM